MNIPVVYWSGTGNTEQMAKAVAEGVKAAGQEADLCRVDRADAGRMAELRAFALGCPSMGAEELEEGEMEPFVQALEGSLSGKTLLLFGSYGWGDGEWMRTWEERMKNAGAVLVNGEGVIANEAPDDTAVKACEEAGKALAAAI